MAWMTRHSRERCSTLQDVTLPRWPVCPGHLDSSLLYPRLAQTYTSPFYDWRGRCSNWTLMNSLKMTMHLFHLLSHLLGSAQTICAISNGHNSTTCVRIFLMISRCHFVVMRNKTDETTVARQSCEIQWRIKKNRWERYDGSEKADVRPERQAVSFMPPHSTF